MEKIKAKDLRQCYLAFVGLYGAIFSEDALKIIKYYFPDITKTILYKDLSSRVDKFTRGYQVIKTTKKGYVICKEYYDFDDLNKLFSIQQDKEFYIPSTYEELLSFSDGSYWDTVNKEILDEFERYLNKRCDNPFVVTKLIYFHVRHDSLNTQGLFDMIGRFGVVFKDDNDLQKFINLYMRLCNKTKTIENRGYSPEEMLKRHPLDLSKTKLSIGPNMKDMFYDDELDVEEYLNALNDSHIPESMKESMKEELIDIIARKKNNKA